MREATQGLHNHSSRSAPPVLISSSRGRRPDARTPSFLSSPPNGDRSGAEGANPEGWPSNPVLFGHDPTPGIVAVEIEQGAERVRVFRRESGMIVSESVPFEPFMIVRDKEYESAPLMQKAVLELKRLELKGDWYYLVQADPDHPPDSNLFKGSESSEEDDSKD